jgi:hypothetical protein
MQGGRGVVGKFVRNWRYAWSNHEDQIKTDQKLPESHK